MFCRVTVVALLLAVSAYAGFFDDVSGEFFFPKRSIGFIFSLFEFRW
ncbi:unnamed protein product [Haemonchus placei]|uniref:Uncharacterized protein n=1 Tax=Haemonchus placei TaxID=6290 RepID=A0A0N4VVN1_HAEPC|nr:unnamed protein product [Haemonchus placei]